MIQLFTLIADCGPLGCITPPSFISPGVTTGGQLPGIIFMINTILRLIFIAAGIWALFNLILAGFQFMTGGGDPKEVSKAWTKIWQTMLGLLIIVASFLIAAILGMLLFHDPGAILNPSLNVK